ncbi:MAG: endonuclease Q family protein [Candidatus Marinimicrobia bacterium]|nr:endonuclease Q family protein [Candidatus Neomarinimicrobiota bacterium]
MELIADLHLHSKYSRAVSRQMTISEMAKWAKKKGIDLVGTSDWTHPLWLRELRNDLLEVGEGVYAPKEGPKGPRFLLVTEIASIYSQGGKGHRIHNLVLAPNFEMVEAINKQLQGHGVKLLSDGRPMTGLSSLELCELVFSVSKECLVIPAHAWTPWYSLYGSRSGFDSIKECFGQFTDQIWAIETGLSSDPAMNWRIEELDKRSIVSFSDAHSPQKLGREATVLAMEKDRYTYQDVAHAIKEGKIASTIEFYPEEGKYHYTGHRNCQVKQSPEETKKLGTTCPVCGKPLTIGVMHRVEELATRPADYQPKNRPPYKMLVPLMEILSESLGAGTSSQTVINEYNRLTERLGSELVVLLKTDPLEIAKIAGEKIAQGIKKVRDGEIVVDPGYDGVFGTVKIWGEKEVEEKKQMSLF